MKKDLTISMGRVLATLFIVICHIISYYTMIPGSAFLGQFFNVGVQMFIMISGILYGRKRYNMKAHDSRAFLRSRYAKVLLPTHIWAIIILLVTGFQNIINTVVVLLNIQGINWIIRSCNMPDGGKYLSHTWFITVILICYLIEPLLYRSMDAIKSWHIAALYLFGIAASVLVNVNILLILYFIAAYYVAANYQKLFNKRLLIYNLLLVVALTVRLGGKILLDGTIIYDRAIVELSQQMLALVIMAYISKLNDKKLFNSITETRAFRFLEKHSFSIYLVHFSFLEPLFEKIGLLYSTIAFVIIVPVAAVGLDLISSVVRNKTGLSGKVSNNKGR